VQSGIPSVKLVIEPGSVAKNYWRDHWRYRELMYFLAWRDIAVRYKQTVIGIAWALLRPAITMLVFVAFGRLVGGVPNEVPAPVWVFAAVMPWQFFSTAVTESSNSLINNSNLISKVYFPRVLVPAAAVATALVEFLITLSMLAFLMSWYGITPGWQLALLPAFVALVFGFSVGLGLLFSALNVEYRDFRFVVPFMVQFGLFVSPIAYTTANVPDRWRLAFLLNPMVGIIDGFRWCLLRGYPPLDVRAAAIAVVVTSSFLLLGLWYFRRMERGFADVI
jgi:lipopolysaccharide transport system permease protein